MLEAYFEKKNQNELLIDCVNISKLGSELSDVQKCKCVNVIADYAIDVFSINITLYQIKQVAFAAVDLIEGLKSKTDEAIVSQCSQ